MLDKEIAASKKLSCSDKIVFSVIKTLCKSSYYCFASNEFFSKNTGLTERQVQRCLSKLKDYKLIFVDRAKGKYFPRIINIVNKNDNLSYSSDNMSPKARQYVTPYNIDNKEFNKENNKTQSKVNSTVSKQALSISEEELLEDIPFNKELVM